MSRWSPLPDRKGPGPRPVGESLDGVTAALGVPEARTVTAVFGSWAEAVGPALAAHARPRALRDGTLVVVVDDPVWATEVRWLVPRLLRRLDEVAGGGRVQRIEVRVVAP